MNWLLYPEAGADVVIFQWSLVSMAGALFWGLLARQARFQQYLRTSKSPGLAHAWFLVSFGVAGAAVMSLPGTFVQSALHEHSLFALNPDVAAALSTRIAHSEAVVQTSLTSWLGVSWSEQSAGTWSIGFKPGSGTFRTKP